MEELNQILKREQEKTQQVAAAKKKAQEEIGQKRQELLVKLAETNFLSDKDKKKVFAYKEQKIAEIKKISDSELEKSLADLKQKEEVNFKKAVKYIVGRLTEDAK